MSLENASIYELIMELARRRTEPGTGLLDSEANRKLLAILDENQDYPVGVILTHGYPKEIREKTHQCSRCHELKEHTEFGYYHSRVDAEGYLMRANALCMSCRKSSNEKRKRILDKADKLGQIPPKPQSGDTCARCGRAWFGNWHRDHDDLTEEFTGWKCGQCNMSAADQRDEILRRNADDGL